MHSINALWGSRGGRSTFSQIHQVEGGLVLIQVRDGGGGDEAERKSKSRDVKSV